MNSIVCNKKVNVVYEDAIVPEIEEYFNAGHSILYVISRDRKYIGCITRKEMLLGQQMNQIVVNQNSVKLVQQEKEEEKVKELFSRYQKVFNIPIVDEKGHLLYEYVNKINTEDFSSIEYWEERYKNGGNSGSGSYNKLAEFKANVLNEFIRTNRINTMVEWGFGDGNQVGLLQIPSYVGYDVSKTAMEICNQKFQKDQSKEFRYYDGTRMDHEEFFDMAISLDVLYHLVEEKNYCDYLYNLFHSAKRFVAIYSSDFEAVQKEQHIKRRKFTEYVKNNFPEWNLISIVKNPYLYDGSDCSDMSNSNFYFYKRQ